MFLKNKKRVVGLIEKIVIVKNKLKKKIVKSSF